MISPISIYIYSESVAFLEGTVQIRKITDSELETYYGVRVEFCNQRPVGATTLLNSGTLYHEYIEPLLPVGSVFREAVFPYPQYVLESQDSQSIEDTILALRLLKTGHLFCPIIIDIKDSHHQIHFINIATSYNRVDFILEENEVKAIDHTLMVLKKSHISRNDEKLDIILSRFNLFIDCSLPKSLRYVEAVSILESIICSNDQNELSFRFSLGLLFICRKLGLSYSLKYFKDMYTDRSKLIHTGKIPKNIDEKLDELSTILRSVVRYYIVDNRGFDAIKMIQGVIENS